MISLRVEQRTRTASSQTQRMSNGSRCLTQRSRTHRQQNHCTLQHVHTHTICTSSPVRVQSIVMCMSVRSHNLKITRPNFTKFSVRAAYGCGSVLLCYRCNMLRTSSFVNEVIFSYNGRCHWKDAYHTG